MIAALKTARLANIAALSLVALIFLCLAWELWLAPLRPGGSWLLLKAFFWRLREKYVIRDFHPLVFFYLFGILMALAGLALGIALIVLRSLGEGITAATGVLDAILLIFGAQFTLFAMWFDMESNKDLK